MSKNELGKKKQLQKQLKKKIKKASTAEKKGDIEKAKNLYWDILKDEN